MQSILSLAQSQRYTTGKWLVYLSPEAADVAWAKIARETASGRLGCSAKVGPVQGVEPTASTVCCIYVKDFSARTEVQRVLKALQALGMQITAGFKPDVFTELNIMSKNKWRIEPTIYKVGEVLEWQLEE